MKKKPKDRHLDVPSEANRDKHINFTALERDETDLADEPATGKLAAEPEKKNWQKDKQDRKKNNS